MTNTDKLRGLLARATPGDLTTAERAQDEVIECPVCQGDGEVEAKDYCNFDHKALGVQFYGIGHEFGAHEELWREVMAQLPALLDEVERLRGALDGFERTMARACDRTIAHKKGVIVETADWHKLMDLAADARLALGREVRNGLCDSGAIAALRTIDAGREG